MKRFIYADNAATTKLDKDAFETMVPWMVEDYGNASQPYFFGKKAQRAIKEARETIAACIHAQPEEIFFTSGGTESDNWVVKCFGAAPSDVKVFVTSQVEHHAILNAAKDVVGSMETHYLPVDSTGIVCFEKLPDFLDYGKRATSASLSMLVSVMMANNEIGTIQPIKEIAKVAHENEALFHTDAVQAVGHIPINVNELGIDLLSASAHKFNGPKGIGFLYDNGKHLYPHNSGGAQEFGRRAGTENVAGIVGMAVALKKNCEQMEKNTAHIRNLEDIFFELMSENEIEYLQNGSHNRLPGNLSISFKGADGEALLHRLDLIGVCVSTGSACDSVNTQISHVLKAINLDEDYARGTIRISLGKENTEEDVKYIVESLKKIIA